MSIRYETDRLIIKILKSDSSKEVLDFYYRNRDTFEPYEPQKTDAYYTLEYQQKLLNSEYLSFLNLNHIRFFVMEKNNPDFIIGTISFTNILNHPYLSCVVGYKFDPNFHKKGLAREALQKSIKVVFNELHIHRIEAYILPANTSSVHFIERNGFIFEGISYKQIELNGKWEDHLRYSLINSKY